MKTVEILGANRFETYTKMRKGSRAIIVQDGNILLTHELNSGWWLLPGGRSGRRRDSGGLCDTRGRGRNRGTCPSA